MTAQRFAEALARRGVRGEPRTEHRVTAAVCVVMGGPDAAPALCFIKRAERPGDPWSGHVAFPGGRLTPADADARAAAMRETAEEIGLDLTRRRFLGALPPLPITRRGRPHRGWLQPFVFLCSPESPVLRPLPTEVAATKWIPVSHLTDPRHRASVEIDDGGRRLVFPAVAYEGDSIWGITYRVVESLLDLGRRRR